MILECIVTTIGPDGQTNIAPMGPIISEDHQDLQVFTLRPYQTARTYTNLKDKRVGVLHVTDNVELFARAAISDWESLPPTEPAAKIGGRVLQQANRWYEFEVETLDDQEDRTTIVCRTVFRGRRTDFVGLNRAKYAVLEAAILMTRINFLRHDEISEELARLKVSVDKTAGAEEARAFGLLQNYFVTHTNGPRNEASINDDG